jgi:hypothetical protein
MNKINLIIAFLKGKKTYIAGIITALYAVLVAFDVISLTPSQEIAIFGLLTAITSITIRSALAN